MTMVNSSREDSKDRRGKILTLALFSSGRGNKLTDATLWKSGSPGKKRRERQVVGANGKIQLEVTGISWDSFTIACIPSAKYCVSGPRMCQSDCRASLAFIPNYHIHFSTFSTALPADPSFLAVSGIACFETVNAPINLEPVPRDSVF